MASTSRHLVVDGSNIATESRTLPSLAQLDEAVRAVIAEDPSRQVTVIVDATFSHRIDQSERKTLDDALDAGEIIMPPAGAVGRGDAFILQVAERANAAVLSNDSFQEFHGEHEWLFEEGRLIGGKPVEGIGWIFVARVPVRGPASRRATRGTSKKRTTKRGSKSAESKRSDSKEARKRAAGPPPKPSKATPPPAAKSRRKKDEPAESGKASDKASKTTDKSARQSSKGRSKNVQELNSLSDFMLFVTQHSIGDEVTAVVESFSSHGCYLKVGSARCYLPSAAMGDPPPTRARDVVSLAQEIIVKVDSLDADRRGINVVLIRTLDSYNKTSAGDPRTSEERNTAHGRQTVAGDSARETSLTRSSTTVATKKTAKKAAKKAPAKKAAKKTAKKAPAKKAAKKAPAKKATKKTAKKATATATSSARVKRATARKAATKKATTKKAAKKAPAKKAAKKAAKKTAKKAPAKKAAKKTAKKAPAKKAAKKTAKKATKKR